MVCTKNINCFPALSSKNTTILILGSIPGKTSLNQQEYYAHPRNVFWKIMEIIYPEMNNLNYQQKCRILLKNKISVWDVLAECQRTNSLDSSINRNSIKINDFETFFSKHSQIKKVLTNGTLAFNLFDQKVFPKLTNLGIKINLIKLPSTSPANASQSFDTKLARWKAELTY